MYLYLRSAFIYNKSQETVYTPCFRKEIALLCTDRNFVRSPILIIFDA